LREGIDFELSPDGKRFLMVKRVADADAKREIRLVLNRTAERDQLAPAN